MMGTTPRISVKLGFIAVGLLSASVTVAAWQEPKADVPGQEEKSRVARQTADTLRVVPTPSRNERAIAYAIPLKDMTIDGKLDGWPEGLKRIKGDQRGNC